MKKLWKYKYFRTAASAVCLTVLGLSFSLAGRKTAEPLRLTGSTEVTAPEGKADISGLQAPSEAETAADQIPEAGTSAEQLRETAAVLLHVYVCGCVERPEVYVLPEGSRITDAVRAAGGFTEDAAQDSRNLAELLTDGEMICIPTKEEWEKARAAGQNDAEASARGMSGTAVKAAEGQDIGRIDLNTAGAEALMTLPGIGKSKAESIIAWREQNGPFRNPEELMKIPGIKQATYDQLKDRITAD